MHHLSDPPTERKMEVFSVLVTGANRGIGLQFVKQFANSSKPPKHIFATYRNKDGLQKLEEIQASVSPKVQIHLVKLDVRDANDLANLKKVVEDTVGDKGLTVLINNAGVVQRMPYPDVTADNLNMQFQVNTIGPILVAQAFLPLLKKAASLQDTPSMGFSKAAILNISSWVASITNTGATSPKELAFPSYKISKASLNMAMRVMAAVVKEDKILIVNICPGFVKTDMGGAHGDLEPDESVASILKTIAILDEAHHGTYVDRHGKPYPW